MKKFDNFLKTSTNSASGLPSDQFDNTLEKSTQYKKKQFCLGKEMEGIYDLKSNYGSVEIIANKLVAFSIFRFSAIEVVKSSGQ